jgi:hypothetical protein
MNIAAAGVVGVIIIGGFVVKIVQATRTNPRREVWGWFAEGTEDGEIGYNTRAEAEAAAERRLSE